MCLQCGRPGFKPCVGKIPWRRERLPTPVFWPGEFHGLYSPWGHKESNTTESLSLSCLSYLAPRLVLTFGKGSICNAGDPGLIPGSGRSTGEGIGYPLQGICYPLQYSWASLVAQLLKNPPAMQENWVQSLGWEDPLEKGKVTQSSILAWRIPWTV